MVDQNNKGLVNHKETTYFIMALLFSIFIYIFLILSLVGWIFLLIGMGFTLFIHGLMIGNIRSNGVRLSPNQFPEIYDKVSDLCNKMGIIKVPEIYVVESSGILNAFATRFFGRNMVVLYSDIFELIEAGEVAELEFVIAHELAHIKRNHITKQTLILPALWLPFLGTAYSRACEYTCDRYAAYYTGNAQASINGLIILAIGKMMYKRVNRSEYLKLSSLEGGFFIWLSEIMSTHPPLPKRIHEIEVFIGETPSAEWKGNTKILVVLGLIVFLIIPLTIAGGKYTIGKIAASDIWAEMKLGEGETLLMFAASENDLNKVNELIESGVDLDQQDQEGLSALTWALRENNVEVARVLLENGANPNIQDHYNWTPLMDAAYSGDQIVARLLLDHGADLNLQDVDGWTALIAAVINGHTEIVKILLDEGAQVGIVDFENNTAHFYAEENGNKEMISLLEQR